MQDQPPSYPITPLGSPSPPPDPLPKLFDDLLDALLYFSRRTKHEAISYSFARCIVERDDFLSAPLHLQAAAHYFYAGGLCRDHNGDRGYKNSRAAMDAMNKPSEAGETYHVLMPDWDKWYADMYGRKVTCSEAYTIHGMGYPEESLPPSISAERFLGMYQAISKEEVLHASEDQDSDQEESSSSNASEDELPASESDG